MKNNTIQARSASDQVPIISYKADRDGAYLEQHHADVIFPKGYKSSVVHQGLDLGLSKRIDSIFLSIVSRVALTNIHSLHLIF